MSCFMKKMTPPLIIFLLAFSVYRVAPVWQLKDSKLTLLLSETLISKGSFKIDLMFPDRSIDQMLNLPQEVIIRKGHLQYAWPLGSAVLSAPIYAALKWFGAFGDVFENGGVWSIITESYAQHLIASIIVSTFVALVFILSNKWLPSAYSWGISFVLAFGTQLLSSASRALWSHTWGILLILLAILLLVKNEFGNKINPYLLATILAWAYFVRPTFNLHIIVISIYMLFYCRKQFIPYMISGLCWLGLFIGFSWYNFGSFLPPYYIQKLGTVNYWEAFAGQLISPSRGIFIFSPFWLLLFYLLVSYKKFVKVPKLAFMSLAVVGIHFLVIPACLPNWWGGYCYGPRITTDLLPWLALLTILGVDAVRTAWQQEVGPNYSLAKLDFSKKAIICIAFITICFSFFTHYRGGFDPDTLGWNYWQARNLDALWNWRNPQFLFGL